MEDIRYIENPFFKIFKIVNPDCTQIYSLLIRLLEKFFKDVKIPTIMTLPSNPKNAVEDISAYAGPSGYLCMYIRLFTFFAKQS